jgi:short-subunit dehydrogenase
MNIDKWIVVSGASKGIGRAVLEQFVSQGYHAVVCARSATALEDLKVDFENKYPKQQLITFSADLSNETDVQNFLDKILSLQINIDVLVNNTGYFEPGQIHNEAAGVLEKMIETNLYSAYNLSRGLIPSMITAKKGHIFNICSIASIIAYPNGGSYTISKFALYGMTKVLREELKHYGIKVTAVLPGATHTASWESIIDQLPPQRLMEATDIAQMIWASQQLSPSAVVEDIVLRPQLGDL